MKLSDEIKQDIIDEYNEFVEEQYGKNDKKKRQELGQFFTPPELTIQMIEMFDCEDLSEKKILDPSCGAGGLLVACILAGAKITNCCGNEYDENIRDICRKRIRRLIDKLYAENPNDYRILIEDCITHEIKVIGEKAIQYKIHCGDGTKSSDLKSFTQKYQHGREQQFLEEQKHEQMEMDLKPLEKVNFLER